MILPNLVRLAPALLLAFSAAGCSSILDGDGFQRDNLANARALWAQKGGDSYTFQLELQCSCAPASELRPVLVTVVNGQVTRRVYVKSRPTDPDVTARAELFEPYDTVEDLFDFVEDAIDRDADVLQVGYNDEFGFPEIVGADYDGGSRTDQRAVLVTEFALTP